MNKEKGKHKLTKRAKKYGVTLIYLAKRLGVTYDTLSNRVQGKVYDDGLLVKANLILDEFEKDLGLTHKDQKEKIVKRKKN